MVVDSTGLFEFDDSPLASKLGWSSVRRVLGSDRVFAPYNILTVDDVAGCISPVTAVETNPAFEKGLDTVMLSDAMV